MLTIKNLVILLICLFSFTKSAVNTKLPKHMVTGYWHNFCNGSKNLKLRDVPSYYNMICVAFTGNTANPGEVTFEVDPDLARAVGGYTKTSLLGISKLFRVKANTLSSLQVVLKEESLSTVIQQLINLLLPYLKLSKNMDLKVLILILKDQLFQVLLTLQEV